MTKLSTNEYLQTELFGECWHDFKGDKENFKRWACSKCKESEKLFGPRTLTNRDFSTKKDFGDLEDKMAELGEWGVFIKWHEDKYCDGGSGYWCFVSTDRAQRADLIAEYWMSKHNG